MTEERRSAVRHRTLKGGRIVINNGHSTFECTVRNLSEAGARIKLASVVGIPDGFELLLDDGRKYDCTVIWRTAAEMGVSFTQPA